MSISFSGTQLTASVDQARRKVCEMLACGRSYKERHYSGNIFAYLGKPPSSLSCLGIVVLAFCRVRILHLVLRSLGRTHAMTAYALAAPISAYLEAESSFTTACAHSLRYLWLIESQTGHLRGFPVLTISLRRRLWLSQIDMAHSRTSSESRCHRSEFSYKPSGSILESRAGKLPPSDEVLAKDLYLPFVSYSANISDHLD
jgi:hypothetical protein